MMAAGTALARAEDLAIREVRQVERLLVRHPDAAKEGSLASWLLGARQACLRGEVRVRRSEQGRMLHSDARHPEARLASFNVAERALVAGRVPRGWPR
jgi:hypothetical protein